MRGPTSGPGSRPGRDVIRTLARTLLAVGFVGGGISHLILGRLSPEGYAVFAQTSLLPWLTELWGSFVMPHIGVLTLLLAAFEIACGVGLLLRGRTVRWAAAGIIGFLVFVTVLGYGWPTTGPLQDLIRNRLPTILLTLVALPLLTGPTPPGILNAWRRILRRSR